MKAGTSWDKGIRLPLQQEKPPCHPLLNHLSLYPETHGFIHSLDGTMAFHPLHGA